MLAAVDAQNQQQILRSQRADILACKGQRNGALQQGVHLEINAVASRHYAAMKVEIGQSLGTRQIKHALIAQAGLRLRGRQIHHRLITQGGKSGAGGFELRRRDQDIQVAGGPQRQVAIQKLRESGTFIRDSTNAIGPQPLQHADQFTGQPQILLRGAARRLPQPCESLSRDQIRGLRQTITGQRREPMIAG